MKFHIKAKNSSGKQELIFSPSKENPEEVHATLVGEYDGKEIQIDFDPIERKEFISYAKSLIEFLEK